MKRFVDVMIKILRIPVWLMILLTVFCTGGLVTVFVMDRVQNPVAYALFALSFYTLCVVCYFFAIRLPGAYKSIKQRIYDHPVGNKYMTDIGYKVRMSLYISLAINLLYSAFKLVTGILSGSFWWGAIAVYYILLSVMRFLLLRYMRSDIFGSGDSIISEWLRYRMTAVIMVFLTLSLSGIVLNMVLQRGAVAYDEISVIAVATYTFYTVTMSIVDLVKYRKYASPVISASKAIRFAAALVSLLSLEASMLTVYGESEFFRRLMISLTGAAVCTVVLAMSIYMILHSNKEIKRIKGVTDNG